MCGVPDFVAPPTLEQLQRRLAIGGVVPSTALPGHADPIEAVGGRKGTARPDLSRLAKYQVVLDFRASEAKRAVPPAVQAFRAVLPKWGPKAAPPDVDEMLATVLQLKLPEVELDAMADLGVGTLPVLMKSATEEDAAASAAFFASKASFYRERLQAKRQRCA